jgi:putative transcriptional regulator
MDSFRGKLLIASPRLADPNFSRTVLLLVQHNEEGAMGLILNRPLRMTIREACEQNHGGECGVDGVLHQGGPCEGPLMVLHGSELAKDADVLPGIFFTMERSKIASLLTQPAVEARYFVNYAGWAPGQLEAEMEVESWIVAEAQPDHVFQSQPSLWQALMTQRLTGHAVDPDGIPDDPSVN